MWYKLTDKSIIFPSSSTIILLMDIDENEHSPFRYTIMPVGKVLEICDKPYCHWTHWMKIPSIENDYIDEEKLDELARIESPFDEEDFAERNQYYHPAFIEGFKAGYRKAMEK